MQVFEVTTPPRKSTAFDSCSNIKHALVGDDLAAIAVAATRQQQSTTRCRVSDAQPAVAGCEPIRYEEVRLGNDGNKIHTDLHSCMQYPQRRNKIVHTNRRMWH